MADPLLLHEGFGDKSAKPSVVTRAAAGPSAPSERYESNLHHLWDHEGTVPSGGSLLSQVLAAVQEELDSLDQDDGSGVDEGGGDDALESSFEDELDFRSVRERRLNRFLEENLHSYSDIEDSVARMEEHTEVLAVKPENAATATATADKSTAKLTEDERAGISDTFASIQKRTSEFTAELLEVSSWLEKRRKQEEDAIDLHREQVLTRAERPVLESPTEHTSRQPSASILNVEMSAEAASATDWTIAEEVSARTDAQQVLEALDSLEMQMQSTLANFYDQLRSLSHDKRAAVVAELRQVEGRMDESGDADTASAQDMRQTVEMLRRQLEQLQASGELFDDEEDPSAEVLRLLQVSAENQAKIKDFESATSKAELTLKLLRGQLDDTRAAHSQAREREAAVNDEIKAFQRERAELQESKRAATDAERERLDREAAARVDEQVSSQVARIRKEAEERRASAEMGEKELSESNAKLREQADALKLELQKLQEAGADGLPPQLASIFSQFSAVSSMKGKLMKLKSLRKKSVTPAAPPPAAAPAAPPPPPLPPPLPSSDEVGKLVKQLAQLRAASEVTLAALQGGSEQMDRARRDAQVATDSSSEAHVLLQQFAGTAEQTTNTSSSFEDAVGKAEDALGKVDALASSLSSIDSTLAAMLEDNNSNNNSSSNTAIDSALAGGEDAAELRERIRDMEAQIVQQRSEAEVARRATEEAKASIVTAREEAAAEEESGALASADAVAHGGASERGNTPAADATDNAAAPSSAAAAAPELPPYEDSQFVKARQKEAIDAMKLGMHQEAAARLSDSEAALRNLENALGGKNLRKLGRAALVLASGGNQAEEVVEQEEEKEQEVEKESPALAAQQAHAEQLNEQKSQLAAELAALEQEGANKSQAVQRQREQLEAAEAAATKAKEEQAVAAAAAEDLAKRAKEGEERVAALKQRAKEAAEAAAAAEASAAEAAAAAAAAEEEKEGAEDLATMPSDDKELLSFLNNILQEDDAPAPPSKALLDAVSERVGAIEASVIDALRIGQDIAKEAKTCKAERAAARMTRDFQQKEYDKLTAEAAEADRLQQEALEKYGKAMTDVADRARAAQLCRVMLERDRLKAAIKQHSATISAFRLLWSQSQRKLAASKKPGKEAAARARAVREQAGSSFVVEEAVTETELQDVLQSANKARDFWKSATKAADKLAKVADAFATNPKTMPNLKGFRDARVTSGQVEVLHEQFVK